MSALTSSVDSTVVRIVSAAPGYDGRSAAFLGSGFFVAPGWVLTCAHVVGKGAGTVTDDKAGSPLAVIADDGQQFEAEVACLLEEPVPGVPGPRVNRAGTRRNLHPLPDIAVVRVPEATDPDCGWLSDRSDLSSPDIGVYGWAWNEGTGPLYLPFAGSATGGRNGRPLVLNGAAVSAGCSGGPVVDHQRGEVIGLSKGRLKSGGGLAVPVTELRALWDAGAAGRRIWREVITSHDRHHRERFLSPGISWPEVQEALPLRGSGLAPSLRTALYAHFAALPQPDDTGEVLAMVNKVRSTVLSTAYGETPIGRPLHHWREGAGLLHDPRDGVHSAGRAGSLEPEAVMLYAAMVHAALAGSGGAAEGALTDGRSGVPVRRASAPGEQGDEQYSRRIAEPAALAGLRAWLLEHRAASGGRESGLTGVPDAARPRGAPYANVLVEIDRDFFGRRAWRVKLLKPDGTVMPVKNNEAGVPTEELEADMREALALALDLGDADGCLASVDVLVDRDLFGEPVDQWRPRLPEPGGEFGLETLPLGRRRVVVLRDRKRARTQPTPEWRGRWRGVEEGPLEAAPLCGSLPDPECPDHGRAGARPAAESEGATYARLSSLADTAVPVHCGPVGEGRAAAAMDVALGSGHAAVLWRRPDASHRRGADEPAGTDCAVFHARAAQLVREAGTGKRLAEGVRDVRKSNGAPGPDAWARNIVLVLDAPGTAVAAPLREPQLQTGAWT